MAVKAGSGESMLEDLLGDIGSLPSWVFLLSLTLGVWIGGYGIVNFMRAIACENWPSVQGRIASATIRYRGGGAETLPSFTPKVTYEYVVEGKPYIGTRRKFGRQHFVLKSPAEEIICRYPLDATVDVYYCPNNPRVAVLERSGGAIHSTTTAVAGIVLIAASIVFLIS